MKFKVMVAAVLAAITTFLYGTLMGWVVHWTIHQQWSGSLHRAHMTHHLKLYPPRDMASDTYRKAGKDDALFVFLPALTVAVLGWCLILSLFHVAWWIYVLVLVETAFVGWLHDYIHIITHLNKHWMHRFKWFQDLRAIHWLHHWNMRKNLGIIWFGWDRVIGTYRLR